jgi:glyoxylate carboligase
MLLSGSEIVVECLKEQGVDTVFGYPGGTILNIYDSLFGHPEIRHISQVTTMPGTSSSRWTEMSSWRRSWLAIST